ncbi:MAG: YdcF family protein [Eubacteriales bacterium]
MNKFSKKQKFFLYSLSLLFVLGIFFFGSLLGFVLYHSQDNIQGEPEIMIILGCQVLETGPSQTLVDRLEKGLHYLKEFPDMHIIVSGGQGSNEPCTEAETMFDYLVSQGVDPSQIYQEGKSHNTHENLTYSIQYIEESKLSGEVMIVSSGFHLGRVKFLWERVGGDDLSVLAADVSHAPLRIQNHLRETLAVVKSFLFDQGRAADKAPL